MAGTIITHATTARELALIAIRDALVDDDPPHWCLNAECPSYRDREPAESDQQERPA